MELYNLLAEHNVIGGLLLDNTKLDEISAGLSASDFYSSHNAMLYSAISDLIQERGVADVFMVEEYLSARNKAKEGLIASLSGMATNTPSAKNIVHYAANVKDYANRRHVLKVLSETIEKIEYSDLGELVSDTFAKAESIFTHGKAADMSMTDASIATVDFMQLMIERSSDGIIGIPSGLSSVDRLTNGFQNGQLIILAARPSIGKTALSNQIALNAAMNGYRVGIISLEMPIEDLTQRSWAHLFAADYGKIIACDDETLGQISHKLPTIKKTLDNVFLNSEIFSLAAITAQISVWKRKNNIDLAVVDHIGLVEGGDGMTKNDWTGKVSRTLKILAKRLSIPIIAVSQMNRDVEKSKRKPILSDLRDSGNVEQDADTCLFLHVNPDHQAINGRLPIEIGLLKNRKGMRGWVPDVFCFDGRIQTFQHVDIRFQDEFLMDYETRDNNKYTYDKPF